MRPPDDGQNHPAPSHFHPLMRPSQGHGDSGESGNPGERRPAHPCHIESLWAVPPQPTVLVRSQFTNAQDRLRSNLNSYIARTPIWGRSPREACSGANCHTLMRRHQRKCSDLGVPAPYVRNSAPMRVYHRRGRLIGESQERVARAIRLRRMPGDVGVSPTTKIPLLLARRRGPGRRLRKARG